MTASYRLALMERTLHCDSVLTLSQQLIKLGGESTRLFPAVYSPPQRRRDLRQSTPVGSCTIVYHMLYYSSPAAPRCCANFSSDYSD